MKQILILGASGTVGSMVRRRLARSGEWSVTGTYCSSAVEDDPAMVRFSLERPGDICPLLERVRPDIVVSALCGDFDKQLALHQIVAEDLAARRAKLLYISTANVFDGDMGAPHTENDTPGAASDYGKFKLRCESLLRDRLGEDAVILRLPFVWGKASPRMRAVRAGCSVGRLEFYQGLLSNHASDLQIAEYVEWIIREDRRGIFHVGTGDVIPYRDFMAQLSAALGEKQSELVPVEAPGTMAVLTNRQDIPARLKWDTTRLVEYLCED